MSPEKTNTKSIILLSGGLDSLTCLAIAKNNGEQCYAISFDYGQKHNSELQASINISKQYNIEHKIISLKDLGNLGGSSLTQDNLSVPDFIDNKDKQNKSSSSIPNTYVPCRNLIFISFACAYAEIIKASKIYIGVNAIDYSGYPDCREEFIQNMQNTINSGTKMGDKNCAPKLTTPLVDLTKAQIIELGHSLGVDYGLSVSCYRANNKLQACGTCDSCTYRKQGFIDAGSLDPTNYIN
jgi:7-cyano-7-deazaguanine synthase